MIRLENVTKEYDLLSGPAGKLLAADQLNIRIDRFQRTTSKDHAELVNQLFEALRANGYIYKVIMKQAAISALNTTSGHRWPCRPR